MSWQHNPAKHCRTADPELFFPVSRTPSIKAGQEEAAKAVCAGCPVLAECRAFAIANLEEGVWGGTTDDERREMRRKRRAA